VKEKKIDRKNRTRNEIILGDLCYIYIVSAAGTAGVRPASGRWAKLRRLLFYVYDYSLYTLNFVNNKKKDENFFIKSIK